MLNIVNIGIDDYSTLQMEDTWSISTINQTSLD